MPRLPDWAPPEDVATALSAAAAAVLATPPALQRVGADATTVDGPTTATLREQHAARWNAHLNALATAAATPLGRLALRLSEGTLEALSDTVRWRRRGDALRLAVKMKMDFLIQVILQL